MKVSFEGIGGNLITFLNTSTAANAAAAGLPVKMTGSGEVSKCTAGGRFMGVAASVNDGCVGVQTAGYIRMTYTGTAPTVGYAVLVATGSESVKVDTASPTVGGEYLVIDVDTTNKLVGFML